MEENKSYWEENSFCELRLGMFGDRSEEMGIFRKTIGIIRKKIVSASCGCAFSVIIRKKLKTIRRKWELLGRCFFSAGCGLDYLVFCVKKLELFKKSRGVFGKKKIFPEEN